MGTAIDTLYNTSPYDADIELLRRGLREIYGDGVVLDAPAPDRPPPARIVPDQLVASHPQILPPPRRQATPTLGGAVKQAITMIGDTIESPSDNAREGYSLAGVAAQAAGALTSGRRLAVGPDYKPAGKPGDEYANPIESAIGVGKMLALTPEALELSGRVKKWQPAHSSEKTDNDHRIDELTQKLDSFVESADPNKMYLPGVSEKDVYGTVKSLGFTGLTMAAGLAARAVGGYVGGKVGERTGNYLGKGAQALAAGVEAFRLDKAQFAADYMRQLDAETVMLTGRPLTKTEWDAALERIEPQANRHAYHEAGWEALAAVPEFEFIRGNVLKTISKIPGAGSLAGMLERVAAPFVTEAADNIVTKAGKAVARGVGRIGALTAAEALTEIPTSKYQGRVEAEVGMRPTEPTWVEAVKETLPQVFVQSALLGGAGQIASKAYDMTLGRKKAEDAAADLHTPALNALQDALATGKITPEQVLTKDWIKASGIPADRVLSAVNEFQAAQVVDDTIPGDTLDDPPAPPADPTPPHISPTAPAGPGIAGPGMSQDEQVASETTAALKPGDTITNAEDEDDVVAGAEGVAKVGGPPSPPPATPQMGPAATPVPAQPAGDTRETRTVVQPDSGGQMVPPLSELEQDLFDQSIDASNQAATQQRRVAFERMKEAGATKGASPSVNEPTITATEDINGALDTMAPTTIPPTSTEATPVAESASGETDADAPGKVLETIEIPKAAGPVNRGGAAETIVSGVEPWAISREAYIESRRGDGVPGRVAGQLHLNLVAAALGEGKPVPETNIQRYGRQNLEKHPQYREAKERAQGSGEQPEQEGVGLTEQASDTSAALETEEVGGGAETVADPEVHGAAGRTPEVHGRQAVDQAKNKTVSRQVVVSETGQVVELKNQDAVRVIQETLDDIAALKELRACL